MRVKIVAIRQTVYPELMEEYENKLENPCPIKEGDVFFSESGEKPQSLCQSAWSSMEYFVKELLKGHGDFFDGWMQNPKSAMISCNDGFRPFSFYIEMLQD